MLFYNPYINMNPTLVDIQKLNKEAERIIFSNNTFIFNGYMILIFVFLIALTVVFSYNYSKKKGKTNTLNKLRYIIQKSERILEN